MSHSHSRKYCAVLTSFTSHSPSPPEYGYLALQMMMFTFGQLLTALAQLFVKPRWTLTVLYSGSIVFAVLCMDVKGYAGITMSLLFPLFLAAIFGTIYTICIRGMGGHTKTAAAILMTATSGGVPFPIIQNDVHQSRGASFAFGVIVALCAAGAPFAIYVNLIPAARRHSDPAPKSSARPLSSQTLPQIGYDMGSPRDSPNSASSASHEMSQV